MWGQCSLASVALACVVRLLGFIVATDAASRHRLGAEFSLGGAAVPLASLRKQLRLKTQMTSTLHEGHSTTVPSNQSGSPNTVSELQVSFKANDVHIVDASAAAEAESAFAQLGKIAQAAQGNDDVVLAEVTALRQSSRLSSTGMIAPWLPFWLPDNYTMAMKRAYNHIDEKAKDIDSFVTPIFDSGRWQRDVWTTAQEEHTEEKERLREVHATCFKKEMEVIEARSQVCQTFRAKQAKAYHVEPEPAECWPPEKTPEQICAHLGVEPAQAKRIGSLPKEKQFKFQLTDMRRLVLELEDSYRELKRRGADDEAKIMTFRWEYDEFQRALDKEKDNLDNAKKMVYGDIERRRNETVGMIQSFQSGWDYESWWMWERRRQLRNDLEFACGVPGPFNPKPQCEDRKDVLREEALKDYDALLTENLERTSVTGEPLGKEEQWNEPWVFANPQAFPSTHTFGECRR